MIEWADDAAGQLLHCSPAVCRGRDLVRFFGGNRHAVIRAMDDARAGEVIQGAGVIRPRERKPKQVAFSVGVDPEHHDSLKWVFELI